MIGGRSALLAASGDVGPYGNWTGNYSDVSLLLRGNGAAGLIPGDESPTPKTITVSGTASVTTTTGEWKYSGSALSFTKSSNSYLQAGSANDSAFDFGSGDFTIEAWIRPSVVSGYNNVVSTMVGSFAAEGWIVYIHSGQLRFITYNNSSNPAINISGGTITANTYTHIAVTRSGTTLRGFVSASQVWSTTVSGNLITTNAMSKLLRVGRSAYTGTTDDYGGQIDDLRITKGIARTITVPTAQLPANVTDDPSYNSVSLLLRGGVPGGPLVPLDESPTPKTITVSGTAAITTITGEWKYSGSALSFTKSSNSYLQVGGGNESAFDFGSGDFTIEAWTRPSVVSGYNNVVSTMVGSFEAEGWIVYIHSGQLRFATYNNSSSPGINISGGAITANAYTHLAVARDNATLRGFANGVQAWSTTVSGNLITTNAMSKLLRVGRSAYTGTTDDYGGQIDDLRITKGIARYKKDFLPPPAQLPAI